MASKTLTTAAEAAGGAAGAVVGGPAGATAGAQAAGQAAGGSGLCDCCCKSGSSAADQKAAINAANPKTGDPAADAIIQQQNDAAFQKWQAADDIKQFNSLPPSTQAQLPAVVDFANAFMAKVPAADRNLTLAQAAAKYPDLANEAYSGVQQIFPALKNVPLATAMALAKASGVDQMKLSDLKSRLDNIVQNDPTAKAIMAKAGGSSGGGIGTIALIAAGVAALGIGVKVFLGK